MARIRLKWQSKLYTDKLLRRLPPKTREYYECGYDQDYRPDKKYDHRHLPGLAGKECGEHEYIIDNAIGRFATIHLITPYSTSKPLKRAYFIVLNVNLPAGN